MFSKNNGVHYTAILYGEQSEVLLLVESLIKLQRAWHAYIYSYLLLSEKGNAKLPYYMVYTRIFLNSIWAWSMAYIF